MSADQFFYLLFSTYTGREVFGQLTYYYSDICMYTLIFGLTMFIMPEFTMNGCMFYRDVLLLICIVIVHTVYVETQNQNVVIASFIMYLVYLICDWKNTSLTHLGMKILMKIKDDDSFEGEFPMKMERRKLNISAAEYETIGEIIERDQKRFDRDLKNHRIVVTLREWQIHQSGLHHIPNRTAEDVKRSIEVKMRLAEAVYKLIFYLRDYIEEGKISRHTIYNQKIEWELRLKMSEQTNRRFPEDMVNSGLQDGKIDEVSEEQQEDDRVSIGSRRQSVMGESVYEGGDNNEMSAKGFDGEDEDGSKSEKSSHSSRTPSKANLHTKNAGPKGFGSELKKAEKEQQAGGKKRSILTWPDKWIDRIVYIIFYPFFLLYWFVMPNIMYKPAIIKVQETLSLGADRNPLFFHVLHHLRLLSH